MAIFRRTSKGNLIRVYRENDISNVYHDNSKTTIKNTVRNEKPAYMKKAFMEYFDIIKDSNTRHNYMALDEAGSDRVLTDLTSKLYDHLVKKTTAIDYGSIPNTDGDITKMDNYEDLKDVLQIIKDICKEYHETGGPVDTITLAMSNLEARKDLFNRAFKANCELAIVLYNNIALGIVEGTSYLIASCIELIKAPADENFSIQMDKIAYKKSRDYLLYTSLDKFNKACTDGDVDKCVNGLIDNRVKKGAVVKEAFEVGAILSGAIGITALILLVILPIIRELIYFFFHLRTTIADYFEMQADILQMNAYNVENSDKFKKGDKKEIARKQLAVVDAFRKIANFVQIDGKQAEVKASRDVQQSKKKYKLNKDDTIEVSSDSSGEDNTSSSKKEKEEPTTSALF